MDGGTAGDSTNADEGANSAAASGEGGAQAPGNSGNSSNAQKRSSSKYATSSINGKQVLEVKCNEQNAELHLSRFANGIRGKSIMYKGTKTTHTFNLTLHLAILNTYCLYR